MGFADIGIIKALNKEFQPGKVRGVFGLSTSGKKLEAGVEICADHGTLKTENETNFDIQLIVSAGAYIDENKLVLKDGGYVLLCDGGVFRPNVEVRKYIKNGRTEKIRPTKVENDELFIYELALDDEKPSG